MGSIPRSLLRLDWEGGFEDGESLRPQEPQCLGIDVSPGMRGKVPSSGDERESGCGVEGGLFGDREAMGDCVSGDWGGSRSRAFSDPVGSDVQPDEDRDDGEERYGARGIRCGARGEEEALGRRVLGQGILHQHGWAARERERDSGVCAGAGWQKRVSSTPQGADGPGTVLTNASGLAPRILYWPW